MAKKSAKKTRRDIYQEVTNRILEILDRGVVPWKNPIKRGNGDGWPKNLSSGKRYRGINVFLLAFQAWDKGYSSDYWLTFRQATSKGGKVRKGEKSSLVTFWKLFEKKDKASGEEMVLPVLRHYNVFNAEQCDGIQAPEAPELSVDVPPFEPIEQATAIVSGYVDPPSIIHGGSKACYLPLTDRVMIANPEQFETHEDYFAILFHELAHSSGHSKRLARGLDEAPAPFGSPDYSKEELIAEMSAAFLNAAAGISVSTIEQSASYIEHWKKKLRGDKRLVVSSAGAAQKAADWILGNEFSKAKKPPEEPVPPSLPMAQESLQRRLF